MLCIKRPKNHPVRPYWDGRARPIERGIIAMLCSAAKHVTEPWRTIGRCGLSRKGVHKPLHSEFVDAHRRIANFILVSRSTYPTVSAFAKHRQFAFMVHFGNCRIACDLSRAGAHRTFDFHILVRIVFGFHQLCSLG